MPWGTYLGNTQIPLFSTLCSLFLASLVGRSIHNNHHCGDCIAAIFHVHYSFHIYYLEFYCKEELSLLLHIQPIFIICRLHKKNLPTWYNLFVTQSETSWHFLSHSWPCTAVGNLSHPKHLFSAEVKQGDALSFSFCS